MNLKQQLFNFFLWIAVSYTHFYCYNNQKASCNYQCQYTYTKKMSVFFIKMLKRNLHMNINVLASKVKSEQWGNVEENWNVLCCLSTVLFFFFLFFCFFVFFFRKCLSFLNNSIVWAPVVSEKCLWYCKMCSIIFLSSWRKNSIFPKRKWTLLQAEQHFSLVVQTQSNIFVLLVLA